MFHPEVPISIQLLQLRLYFRVSHLHGLGFLRGKYPCLSLGKQHSLVLDDFLRMKPQSQELTRYLSSFSFINLATNSVPNSITIYISFINLSKDSSFSSYSSEWVSRGNVWSIQLASSCRLSSVYSLGVNNYMGIYGLYSGNKNFIENDGARASISYR